MIEAEHHWTCMGREFINASSLNSNIDFRTFPTNSNMKNKKSNDESKAAKINFWNLSSKSRFILNKQFTGKLFESSKLDFHQLAKKLGVSYPFVIQLRKNKYSIPVKILVQLSALTKVSLEQIQENIVAVKGRAGKEVRVQFPIRASSEIASLIGHVFGDGYIGRDRTYFEYCNDNLLLVEEVKESIRNVFHINPTTEKVTRITYPTIVGEILLSFGAPVAPKIQNRNQIPGWVHYSKKYKRKFLKAFFDDDGSVMVSQNYRAKGLNLYVIRHQNHEKSALGLLEQIRIMLLDFGIVSGAPKISRIYEKSNGKRVVCYINITDYQSLFNYYRNIGLANGNKFSKLQKIVKRKFGGDAIVKKPKKVLVLGSGSLKIGEAGETL